MAQETRSRLQAWVKLKNLKLVRQDAKRFNRTLDSITDRLLQDFLALKQTEREKLYQQLPNKRFGRPAV